MDLTNLQEYHDYFESLAGSHISINSFLYGDEAMLMEASRSSLILPVLWLEPYQPATIIDNLSDNEMDRIQGTLAIYTVPDSELHADEFTKVMACEGIIKDILSRMKKDHQDGTIYNQIGGAQYGRSLDIMGASKLVGCRLDFTFLRPARLVYNSANWQ